MKINSKKIKEAIPLLSEQDKHIDGTAVILGIDTEMLFAVDDVPVWPHLVGLPQERPVIDRLYNAAHDWHGDGYAFELCTLPVTCLEYLSSYLGTGIITMANKLAPPMQGHKQVKLLTPVVYSIPKDVEDAAPDAVKRLGCTPSNNVYGDNGTPQQLGSSLRTTGCHLHISAGPLFDKEATALAFIQWADLLVGNAWNYVSPEDPRDEQLRRQAYGKAGEFRVRVYPTTAGAYAVRGVEYRVLPGSVMKNPIYLTLCFNLYRTALRFALELGAPTEEVTTLARRAINRADKDISEALIGWLPFSSKAKRLLKIIKDTPLPVLSPAEWHMNTVNSNLKGHRYFAVQEKIAYSQHEGE